MTIECYKYQNLDPLYSNFSTNENNVVAIFVTDTTGKSRKESNNIYFVEQTTVTVVDIPTKQRSGMQAS